MDPKTPKLDVKMFLPLAIFFLSKNIDFKNEDIMMKCWIAFGSVMALMIGLYGFIYLRIQSADSKKKIWVPPKAQQSLPFGMGPEPKALTPEDFTETTYADHEKKVLFEAVQGLCFSAGMAVFMGWKFNIHMTVFMNIFTTPVNAIDTPLVKKYLLGQTKDSEGKGLFQELDSKPTVASLAALNPPATTSETDEKKAPESITTDDEKKQKSTSKYGRFSKNESRVEELDESTNKDNKKKEEGLKKRSSTSTKPSTSAAHELD